jgi:DNA-binding MarR family transcriptional regulator/N-acetylglutamate synthase-like GNAT family acetyltransferase
MSIIMQDLIKNVRQFNRFYTKQLGLLNEHLLESPFSLTEARIMYELAHRENSTASELAAELGLDAGQLSRILRDFEKRSLIEKARSETDARQTILRLTPGGKAEFEDLNALSSRQIEALLDNLSPDRQTRLVRAMNEIETLLAAGRPADKSFILRNPEAGDYGWVVQKNGEIYAEEYRWDEKYEGLVAEIVAEFIRNFDPKRERCWIAEKDGVNRGAVFLVKKDETTAKLRLLIVDPEARGLGIGQRLVEECTRFARKAGYRKITLWTNSILSAARRIYEKEGYKMVEAKAHHSFGQALVGETWELDLN